MTDTTITLRDMLDRLSPERVERIRAVVAARMQNLTIVLEALYDPGNRAAVFRTAEAFGLLNVHVIKKDAATKMGARHVSRGTEKWLHIHEHPNSADAVDSLRADGFRIYAADLQATAPLHDLDFSGKVALVFGNEHRGISNEMREAADARFVVPMHGFAESLNISTAAAVTLAWARESRERSLKRSTDLDEAEADALFAEYVERSSNWVRRVRRINADKSASE
jgi:tRNA (guanosine-2'-O-)-methyltransferase